MAAAIQGIAGRATQGAAPTPAVHKYCPDLDYDNIEKCGFRVSMSGDWCNKQRDNPIHQRRDEPQGTQSTDG